MGRHPLPGHGAIIKAATTAFGQRYHHRSNSQSCWNVSTLRRSLRYGRSIGSSVPRSQRILSCAAPSDPSHRYLSSATEGTKDEVNASSAAPPQSFFQQMFSVVRTTFQSFTATSNPPVEAPQVKEPVESPPAVKEIVSNSSSEEMAIKSEESSAPSLDDFVIKNSVINVSARPSESAERATSDDASQRKMDFIRSKMAPLVSGSHLETPPLVVVPVSSPTSVLFPKEEPPVVVIPGPVPLDRTKKKTPPPPMAVPTANLSDTVSNLVANPPNIPFQPLSSQHNAPTTKPTQSMSNSSMNPSQHSTMNPSANAVVQQLPVAPNSSMRKLTPTSFAMVPEMPFHLPEVISPVPPPIQRKSKKSMYWKNIKQQNKLRKQLMQQGGGRVNQQWQQRGGQGNQQWQQSGVNQQMQQGAVQERVTAFAVPVGNALTHVSHPTPPQHQQKWGGAIQRYTGKGMNPQAINALRSQFMEQVQKSRPNTTQSHSSRSHTGSNTMGGQTAAVNVFRHRPEEVVLRSIRSQMASTPQPSRSAQPNPFSSQSMPQNMLNSVLSPQHQQLPNKAPVEEFKIPSFPASANSYLFDGKNVLSRQEDDSLAQVKARLPQVESSSVPETRALTGVALVEDRRNAHYNDAMQRIRSRMSQQPVPIFEPVAIQSIDTPQPWAASPLSLTRLESANVVGSLENTKQMYSPQVSQDDISNESTHPLASSRTSSVFDAAGSLSDDNYFFSQLESRLSAHQNPEVTVPLHKNNDSASAATKDLFSSPYMKAMEMMRSKLPKDSGITGVEQKSPHPEIANEMASDAIGSILVAISEPLRQENQIFLDQASSAVGITTNTSMYGKLSGDPVSSDADCLNQEKTHPSGSFNVNVSESDGDQLTQTSENSFARLRSRIKEHQDPQHREQRPPDAQEVQATMNSNALSSNFSYHKDLLDRIRSKAPQSNVNTAVGKTNPSPSSDVEILQNTDPLVGPLSDMSFGITSIADTFSTEESDVALLRTRLMSHQYPQNQGLLVPAVEEAQKESSRQDNVLNKLRSQFSKTRTSALGQESVSAVGGINVAEVHHQPSVYSMNEVRQYPTTIQENITPHIDSVMSRVESTIVQHGSQMTRNVTREKPSKPVPDNSISLWQHSGQSGGVQPFHNQSAGALFGNSGQQLAQRLDSANSVLPVNENDEILKLQARVGRISSIVDGASNYDAVQRQILPNSPLSDLHTGSSDDDKILQLQAKLRRSNTIVDSTSILSSADSHFVPKTQLGDPYSISNLLQSNVTGTKNVGLTDDPLHNLQKRLERQNVGLTAIVPTPLLTSTASFEEDPIENTEQFSLFPVDARGVNPSRLMQGAKNFHTTALGYSSISNGDTSASGITRQDNHRPFHQQNAKSAVMKQKSNKNVPRKDMLDRISEGLSELVPLAKPLAVSVLRSPDIEPKARIVLRDLQKFASAKKSAANLEQPGMPSMNQESHRQRNLMKTSEHLPTLPNPSKSFDRMFGADSTKPHIQSHRESTIASHRFRFQDQSSSFSGIQSDSSSSSSSFKANTDSPLSVIIEKLRRESSLSSQAHASNGQNQNEDGASFHTPHHRVIPKWRQPGNVRDQQIHSPTPIPRSPPPPAKPVFVDPKQQAIALPSFEISLTETSQLLREKTSRLIEILERLGEKRPEGIGEDDNESWMLSKETLELIAMEIGQLVEESSSSAPALSDEELLLMRRAAVDAQPLAVSEAEQDYKSFPARPPVVCIMGHVDHGKTTLMDALRRRAAKDSAADTKKGKDKKKEKKKDKGKKAGDKSSGDVAGTEAGGITQVISAFEVPLIAQDNGTSSVTFLDTPGHASFSAMRQSGSDAADIIVLVIAADDGVSEQTVEILNFYKSIVKGAGSGGISLVVAMNKIDKPGIDVEEATRRIQGQLLEHGILTEGMPTSEGVTEYGPAVQMIPISGLTGLGLDDLVDGLVLQSEMMDLRAPIDSGAEGIVMDSRIDKGMGVVVDCIVRWGSLQKGDFVISGSNKGKVRLLKDVNNAQLKKGLPSQPVRIVGFDTLPKAGDPFICVASEEAADELVSRRKAAESANVAETASPTPSSLSDAELQSSGRDMMTHAWKDALETKYGLNQDDESAPIRIPVVIKADADGTLAAIRDSLIQMGQKSKHNVLIDPIKVGVGPLLPSEIQMAEECHASIVCFNIKNDQNLVSLAEENNVCILQSDIIYTLLDEAKLEFSKHLPKMPVEVVHGRAKVLALYDIGGIDDKVAGLKVLEGTLFKDKTVATKGVESSSCQYRVVRDGTRVVNHLTASSLKHFKADVTEVQRGKECGISLSGHNEYEIGDEVECFSMEMQRGSL